MTLTLIKMITLHGTESLIFLIVFLLISSIAIYCATWVIYKVWVVEKDKKTKEEKLFWTLFSLFFNIITAAMYFFSEKNKNNNNLNSNQNDNSTWN